MAVGAHGNCAEKSALVGDTAIFIRLIPRWVRRDDVERIVPFGESLRRVKGPVACHDGEPPVDRYRIVRRRFPLHGDGGVFPHNARSIGWLYDGEIWLASPDRNPQDIGEVADRPLGAPDLRADGVITFGKAFGDGEGALR